MNNTPVGIDTLHINPQNWALEDNFAALVTPSPFYSGDRYKTADHLLYEVKGEKFYGTGAELKFSAGNSACVLTFNTHYDKQSKKSDKWEVSTKITMTVPKIIGPDNYYPANCKQLQEALDIVQAELAQKGFKFDINAALVKRLDMARTFQVCESWENYLPVLAVLTPSRMPSVNFPTGQRWGKDQCQMDFYEKGLELASHYGKVLQTGVYREYPENSIRVELRWLERTPIRVATGVKTVSDLISNFDHVQNVYRAQFKKRLFIHTADQFNVLNGGSQSVGQIVEEMRHFGKKRNWFNEWSYMDWARNLSAERMETIRAAVKKTTAEKGKKPQNLSALVRKMKEYHVQYAQPVGSARSVADLYCELRDKVLAE